MKFEIQLSDPADAQRRIDAGFAHQDITVDNGKFEGKGFAGMYAIKGNVLHVSITDKPFIFTEKRIKQWIEGYLK